VDLCISLDFATADQALNFLGKVKTLIPWVRVTPQLFFPFGVPLLQSLRNLGYKIFLDLRLCDTPVGMASALFGLKGQPVDMLSIQSISGPAGMKFSRIACDQALPDTKLVAITVLYHLQRYESKPEHFDNLGKDMLLRYGQIAVQSKVFRLLCAPYELPYLHSTFGANAEYVVLGLRAHLSTLSLQIKNFSRACLAIFDDSLVRHPNFMDVVDGALEGLRRISADQNQSKNS
jgi:orotidine-5'-phosphate decarboxylase